MSDVPTWPCPYCDATGERLEGLECDVCDGEGENIAGLGVGYE